MTPTTEARVEDLFTEDSRARARALDPRGSFLVQAPAGSGKTTLLAARYLALLATVEHPEEIVALTFTRKAAGEMAQRVLDALGAGESDGGGELGALAARVRDHARRRNWDEAELPLRLRIHTIDQLALGIVRRRPQRAGGLAHCGPTEDAEPMYRAAARLLLEEAAGEGDVAEAVRRLLLHLDAPRRFLDLVERMLARREQWLPVLRRATERQPLEKDWVEFLETRCAAAGEPPGGVEEAEEWLGRIGLPRGGLEHSLKRLRILARSLLTQKGTWYAERSGSHALRAVGIADDDPHRGEWLAAWKRLWNAFAGDGEAPPPAWLTEIPDLPDPDLGDWALLQSLLLALAHAVLHLRTVFLRERRVDFIEITRLALDALGEDGAPSELQLALDYRLRHLLVDEFQDTSLTHYAFLTRLVGDWRENEGRTFFAVGDPMQSIYRFRQADVAVFLDVRRRRKIGSLALEPLVLHRNFRAAPALVAWVNRFARAFPRSDDPDRGEVRFVRAVAARADDPGAGVHFHAVAPEDEASALAALLADPGAPCGRRAILLRSRLPSLEIVAALRARGIRPRLVDIVALGAVPAVGDLLALSEALLHPADRRAWLAVLRAPWCGLGNAALAALTAAAGDFPPGVRLLAEGLPPVGLGEETDALLAAAARHLARGVDLVARYGLRRGVEATWVALGGPALLDTEADLRAAERYLGFLDEPGIVELWRLDPARFEERVRTLYAPEEAAGEDAPEILTIHGAKGLEWDEVFLPSLSHRPRSHESDLLAWQDVLGERGRRLLLLAHRPSSTARRTSPPSTYKYLGALERDRDQAENVRLAYVAATRARMRLHLFLPPEPPEQGGTVRRGTLAEVFVPLVEEWPRPSSLASSAPRPPTGMRPVRTRLVRPFALPFSLSQGGEDDRVVEEAAEEGEEARPETRAAGRVLHAFLARLAGRSLPPPGGEPPPGLGSDAIRAALRAEGLAGEGLTEAERIVRTALVYTWTDRRGRWILAPHAEGCCEWNLEWLDPAGEIRRLRIDRTFRDRRGRRWIVDYKLGRHEGGGTQRFLEEASARHRLQLETYARALRGLGERGPIFLGLYFPLLRAWRAWRAAEDPPSCDENA